MTRDEESKIREVFRRHLEEATDEITELDIDVGYLPPGYSGRFAEIMTQALALMSEASETAMDEMADESA